MSQTPTSGNQSPQLSLSPPPSLLHSLTRSDSSPPGYYSPSMVRILAAVEFVHTTPVPTIVEPHIDATADPDVLDAHSVETPPGPLGIKFTGYRLLNMTVLIAVGLAKFILSLKGQSTIPTALEWMSGSILAAILYWLGLYEAVQPPRWIWFHHADYAPAIGHFPKYFVGGVMHSVELCWRLLPFILFSNIPTVVIILVQSHFFAFFIDNTVVLVFTNLASCILPEALMLIFPEKWRIRKQIWVWRPIRRFFHQYGAEHLASGRYRLLGRVGFMLGIISTWILLWLVPNLLLVGAS